MKINTKTNGLSGKVHVFTLVVFELSGTKFKVRKRYLRILKFQNDPLKDICRWQFFDFGTKIEIIGIEVI